MRGPSIYGIDGVYPENKVTSDQLQVTRTPFFQHIDTGMLTLAKKITIITISVVTIVLG